MRFFHGVTGLAYAQILYPDVGGLLKFSHYNKFSNFPGLRIQNIPSPTPVANQG